jgi:hypothetical protein
MIAHSGDAKKAESGKLRRASSKRRQVGRKIEGGRCAKLLGDRRGKTGRRDSNPTERL